MSKSFGYWYQRERQQNEAHLNEPMPPATVYAGDGGQTRRSRRAGMERVGKQQIREMRRQRERERLAEL